MRIFTVSDLHVDYPENLKWVLELPSDEFAQDVLILPGDVSDSLELLKSTFEVLKSRFGEVLYVPGNHELWVDGTEFECSLEKFHAVMALCQASGVETNVFTAGKLSIVPLLSWYDFSFGEPCAYLKRAWRDFKACRWPAQLQTPVQVCEFFLQRNTAVLETVNDKIISFSHFLPRIDVMPSRIPAHRRRVYPVLGSAALDGQVKRLNSNIHIYGHSHVNQSVVIDDIHYINNAYAYPKENRIARKRLHCVFDTDKERDCLIEAAAAGGSLNHGAA